MGARNASQRQLPPPLAPTPHIAEVVFNLPLERTFHYLIPQQLAGTLRPGMRVAAPFGPRELIGFIAQLVTESPIRELKPIRRALDPVPVVADERWALASWLAGYYGCSLGEALSVMVPSGLRFKGAAQTPGGEGQAGERTDGEPPARGSGPAVSLTPDQRRALQAIADALNVRRSQTFLLHGVTGSGKTELYLQAIARVLQQGRSAICLVPEIALTPQITDRFRERFGDQVAIWHSRLTARQRAEEWRRMLDGSRRIVVGARSAVFAPVRRLGLMILDEEHEPTYKQEDVPRYHAR